MKKPLRTSRPSRHPAVFWSRMKPKWPILVWLVAVWGAWSIYDAGTQFGSIMGVVTADEEVIAPIETGLLVEITVSSGQEVKKGDILARMDTSLIQQRINVLNAIQEEKLNLVEDTQGDVLRLNRQFAADRSRALGELLAVERAYAEAKAELTVLIKEEGRLKRMEERRLTNGGDITTLGLIRANIAALEASVLLYPDAIANLNKHIADMDVQVEYMNDWLQMDAGADEGQRAERIIKMLDARKKIHEQERKLLNLRAERAVLKASSDSTVSRIESTAGSVVSAGEPIVTLIHPVTDKITAFLPEGQSSELTNGMNVIVERNIGGREKLFGQVTSLGPEIYGLPSRISPVAETTIRGRRLLLTLDPGSENSDMIPGETVTIYGSGQKYSFLPDFIGKFMDKKSTPAKKKKTKTKDAKK